VSKIEEPALALDRCVGGSVSFSSILRDKKTVNGVGIGLNSCREVES
jgi:hypothetical protein